MKLVLALDLESLSPPAESTPPAPSIPVISGTPTISGLLFEGETLTATPAPRTGYPLPARTWQWERDGAPIAGATGATYLLQPADVGATLTVVQTETNSEGADSAESASTGAIQAALEAPVITGVPTISGTEEEGETLTATPAAVTGNPAPVRTWQWERDGAPIAGATAATYLLQAADVGETLTVVQTETNSEGVDSAESAATGVIDSAPAPATITLTTAVHADASGVADTLTVGRTVTGTPGTITYYLATGGASLAVTAAQLIAGDGGTDFIEFDNVAAPSDSTPFDLSGFSAASDLAPKLAICASDGTAISNVLIIDLPTTHPEGLDYTNPVASSASTNVAGTQTTITMSEIVVGTEATGDWNLTEDSSPLAISAVSISGSTITLTHAAASNGTTLELDYSGGDVRDQDGRALAAITDMAVTNNVPGSYTETLVRTNGSQLLTADATLGADAPGVLWFWTGIVTGNTRQKAGAFSNGNVELRIDSNGGDSLSDASVRSENQLGGQSGAATVSPGKALSQRVHILATTYISGSGASAVQERRVAMWNATDNQAAGSWQSASNTSGADDDNDDINLTDGPLVLYANPTSPLSGDTAGLAVYTFADPADVPDITSAACQNAFVSGAATVAPATTDAFLTGATKLGDTRGHDAADHNSGSISGTLSFTATGTFTDV